MISVGKDATVEEPELFSHMTVGQTPLKDKMLNWIHVIINKIHDLICIGENRELLPLL